MFVGLETFNENLQIVILDDFGIDLNKFLPGWKCWLGAQTGFSVNLKYGRRKKINWGHPCIFLSNKKEATLMNLLDEEERDYIRTNCIIIDTGKRFLYKKPKGDEELAKNEEITINKLREKYYLQTNFENLYASDIENENKTNEPILIENKKRKLDDFDEPLKGRLLKKIRRTGSGF